METPSLLHTINLLLETPDLPPLGPEVRPSATPIPPLEAAVKKLVQEFSLPAGVGELFQAGLYLWHDHLDEAHTIVQELENKDGSLLHGIMHRREPDYGNAKYWFRRVGPHPSFLSLAVKAGDFLEEREESDLRARLVPNNSWDPFAFVDACEDALNGQFPGKTRVLQEVQKLEFECFFDSLANRI